MTAYWHRGPSPDTALARTRRLLPAQTTTAVVLGGNSVILAQELSAAIITSTLIGMFYYGEGDSTPARVVWLLSAAVTLAAMVLLGLEKQ